MNQGEARAKGVKVLALLALLSSPLVLAAGQTTHVRVTRDAVALHPPGELRDLLQDPALQPWLINGAMFPDGGYAVDDPYGEMAHWADFHDAYLSWVRERYASPWSPEARQHIAFLMGMVAHSICDEVYDSLYMERGRQEDSSMDWDLSFDQATDVAFAARAGPESAPELLLPLDALVELYSAADHEVQERTIEAGQTALGLALAWVGAVGSDPELAAPYEAWFPWSAEHLFDQEIYGSTPWNALAIARIQQDLWRRLEGVDEPLDPILLGVPEDGDFAHPPDSTRVESRLGLVFARGLDASSVEPQDFTVLDPNRVEMPLGTWVFYGDSSHVVLLEPQDDWAPDTCYDLTIRPGIQALSQPLLGQERNLSFCTSPWPAQDISEVEPGERGCAVGLYGARRSSSPLSPWGFGLVALLLGLRRRIRKEPG